MIDDPSTKSNNKLRAADPRYEAEQAGSWIEMVMSDREFVFRDHVAEMMSPNVSFAAVQ